MGIALKGNILTYCLIIVTLFWFFSGIMFFIIQVGLFNPITDFNPPVWWHMVFWVVVGLIVVNFGVNKA